MSYRPDENALMSYLYGEIEGEERDRIEKYLLENPEAQSELQNLRALRKMLGTVADKEVIAPPLFIGDAKQRPFWNSSNFKTVMSIAASLVLLIVVGKLTNLHINYGNHELKLSFGDVKEVRPEINQPSLAALTPEQVQAMINTSLNKNNEVMQISLKESQQKLDASIQKNLLANSTKVDKLVREASTASEEQIQQYVVSLQSENAKLVKDYFQLTSTEQKKYIEDLLVDFAKYLQQQHSNDLQIVQTRLNSLEKNTDMFKQETEQILSSIITSAGGTATTNSKGTRN
jgi:hypothetical protein